MLCHLIFLLGIIPMGSFLQLIVPYGGVAFIWALKKDDKRVKNNARASLNWQFANALIIIGIMIPTVGFQLYEVKRSASQTEVLMSQLDQAKTDQERSEALAKLEETVKIKEGWRSLSYLSIFGLACIFLVGIWNLGQTIRNAILAFRKEPLKYPYQLPIFKQEP